jgi:hypothetical protein
LYNTTAILNLHSAENNVSQFAPRREVFGGDHPHPFFNLPSQIIDRAESWCDMKRSNFIQE